MEGAKIDKELYYKQTARVRIGGELTEEIEIGRGVRQGCCLSPTLFNLHLEEIIGESFDGKRGVSIGGRRIECIRFADDMEVIAENTKVFQEILTELNNTCKEYGMNINKKKTKFMILGGKGKRATMKIEGETIEQVNKFQYLEVL